jgi:hypothetical protein
MVGSALSEIYNERGRVAPEDVVEYADDPASPLHSAFEWDDTVAAQQHRLAQARSLIKAVRVRRDPDGQYEPVFVNVRIRSSGPGSSVYKPIRFLTKSEAQTALDFLRQKIEQASESADAVLAVISSSRKPRVEKAKKFLRAAGVEASKA